MNQKLNASATVRIFLVFALVYFLSTLARAVMATLAPELTQEFDLSSSQLGLLAGSYFIGFCLMQIPLGICLDRFGPPRTAVAFLIVALVGSSLTATAQSFEGMLFGRILLGLGLAAGLMAPLTAYRRWFSPAAQVRANAWMLTVGSLGMLMSTLPVQWLLPLHGWRGVFWVWTGVGGLAIVGLLLWLPRWQTSDAEHAQEKQSVWMILKGYGDIVRNRRFISVAPLGFFGYGGMFAILTLWAGPWLREVAGNTPAQAASGLFSINVLMMLAFFVWGLVAPRLDRYGVGLERLALSTMVLGLSLLPVVIALGSKTDWLVWAVYCVSLTGFSLVQPKLAQHFPVHLAGRALTGFNLCIFSGTFFLQWSIGVAIDAFASAGFERVQAYQSAFLMLWAFQVLAFGWFLRFKLKLVPSAKAAE